ncbi:MAG: methyl-accepting chemotaxis protein [Treponema sp.]|jgi:methyl-accepting chemotaxis protein|nr:methyl-accepting chemotaxis protein [Treponema sp.]
MKFKLKLNLIVIGLVALVIGSISLILLSRSSSMQMKTAIESMRNLAAEQAMDIRRQMELHLQITQTMAGMMNAYNDVGLQLRRIRFERNMESIALHFPMIVGIFSVWKPNVLDGLDAQYAGQEGYSASGQYIPYFCMNAGKITRRAYANYQQVTAGLSNVETISNPEPRIVNGKATYVITITAPVISNRDKQLVGMVGVEVSIDALQPYIENILRDNHNIDALSVYTNDGTIIASFDPSGIGKNLRDADQALYTRYITDALNAVKRGHFLQVEEYSSFLKMQLQMAICPITIGTTTTPWAMMMATSKDTILAGVNRMTITTIIVALVLFAITVVVVLFVASSITKPLIMVSSMMKEIGSGDLTQHIVINSKDEIGEMSHFINIMVNNLKNLILVIKHRSNTLFDIGHELSASMTQTAAAINEITANIQGIRSQVINQATSVIQTNASMGNITVNIDKLNSHVEHQSSSVAQSSAAIEEMLANIQSVTATLMKNAQNVKELAEASEVGRNSILEVVSDIQEIDRESEGLLEINAVMQNIASQTNLLSMNAAIEAAHAGEAGKGFAVVADEIRKLAENSSDQSKTISTVLKKIHESIDKITKSTDAVKNKFEAIDNSVRIVADQEEHIRNAMEEQSEGSKQVLEAVAQMNEITQQVKGGSVEMLEGSKEVIQEGKNLETVTQEITNSMNGMSTGADQINVVVNRVNEISCSNKENIAILVNEVSKFKVE